MGIVIGYFNIVWLFPKCLPLEEIGLLRFVLEMGLFLAYFAQIGIPNAVNRFYPYFRTEDKKDNGFQFWIFVIPLIGIFFFSIIFILIRPLFVSSFQENSPLVLDYYWYFIPFTITYVYLNVTEQYCSTQMRIVVPKLIRDVYLRAVTSLLLIATYFNWISFSMLMQLLTVAYALAVVVNFSYIYWLRGIDLHFDYSVLANKVFRKEIIYFLGFIIIVGIGSTIVNKIDGYMISSLINLSSYSVYSTALFIATVIEMPYRSISQISTPIVAEAMKQNNMQKVEELYKKSSINQSILGIFIFLLIWVNADSIFDMMPNGDAFRAGKYVILFIGLSKIFDLLTGINSVIMGNSKFYYYGIYFMFLLATVAIGLNYLLIPEFGILGVGIATAISIFIYASTITYFVKVKTGLHPFSMQTVKLLAVGLFFFILNAIMPRLPGMWVDIFVRSLIVVGGFAMVVYLLKLSLEMNQTAMTVVRKALGKN
jgi:O-antigen/teichoic acid export membrane protein